MNYRENEKSSVETFACEMSPAGFHFSLLFSEEAKILKFVFESN